MNAIQPEDQGYWLLTKGSTPYWQENDLPFGTARNSASQRKKQCCSGNGNHNLYGLWQKNDQDEREYLSLRSLLSYRLKILFIKPRRGNQSFLKTHHSAGKCGQKAEQTHDELAVQCTLWLSYSIPLFALRLLSLFAVAQRFY